jgi:uncharacterized protein YukE
MTYADTVNPLGRLNPPGDYRDLATQSVLDALPGIVGWINDAVRWITRQFGHEINVVQWLLEAVGGDWSDLLSLRDSWNNLSWASADIGTNIVRGLTELNPHWDGNAAQAFDAHMSKWYGALTQNQTVCAAIRDHMQSLAQVAKEFLQAAIDILQMLFSILGSGGPIVAVLRAADIADGVIKTYRAYDAVKKTIQAIKSVFESIAAMRDTSAPNTRVEVPTAGYGGPTAPGTM